ncbi:hypothetical protein DMB37_29090 [Nocardia sp. CS682]|nr:hypothetical protein DMB37_29090 [Nocardia sp. CS682]
MAIDLSEDERELLRCGLSEWGGPANCTDALAVAMGFQTVADLFQEGRRLRTALIAEEPLTARDWRRTLVATEFVFASDVFGSGQDWSITTGLSDETTVKTLRRVQRKLAVALREVLFGPRPR